MIVFPLHVRKRSKTIRYHFHVSTEKVHFNRGDDHMLDFNGAVMPENLPNGVVKLTLVAKDGHLDAVVSPRCTASPECAAKD